MRLDRPLTEEESGGDLPVRTPLGDEGGHPPLGSGQALLPHAAADPTLLRAGRLDPRRRPELLEPFEGGGDRRAGGALLPLPPPDDSEREQGASAPEGI